MRKYDDAAVLSLDEGSSHGGLNSTTVVRAGCADWATVTAGRHFTCGIPLDGTLWCWGYNAQAQLGDGTTLTRYSPVPVGPGLTWASVSGAYQHTCAISVDGGLYCWGTSANGRLGDGTTAEELVPVRIAAFPG